MTPKPSKNCKYQALRAPANMRIAPELLGIFVIVLLLVLALVPGRAQAAFAARTEVLGFSADGKWFVFEEYGVQDGSGMPFSRIFVIDVENNAWRAGTPFVEQPKGEGASYPPLTEIRRRVHAKAGPTLAKIKPLPMNGFLMLRHMVSDLGAAPHEARFRRWYTSGPAYALTLTERDASAAPCGMAPQTPKVFTLRAKSDDGAETVLQNDTALPKSRGCALSYAINGVWMWFANENRRGRANIVVLLHILAAGFEGPDVRYMAVSGKLPE